MPDTPQAKPNPLPAILVYGTPSGPALTQASWFRAEDKEVIKAAAKELKFAVIELQTEADLALAAGAHEGTFKAGGRMIVGSVSAEVYRRIEEHVRQAACASASAQSKPEIAAATTTTKVASEQNTNAERRSAFASRAFREIAISAKRLGIAHLQFTFERLTLAVCSRVRRDGVVEIEMGVGVPRLPKSAFTAAQLREAEAASRSRLGR
jgi:hypothetical protein